MALVIVIAPMVPEPLAVNPLSPAGGVMAVQVKLAPCTSAVNEAGTVGIPLQTVCPPGLFKFGIGLTLKVYVTGALWH